MFDRVPKTIQEVEILTLTVIFFKKVSAWLHAKQRNKVFPNYYSAELWRLSCRPASHSSNITITETKINKISNENNLLLISSFVI